MLDVAIHGNIDLWVDVDAEKRQRDGIVLGITERRKNDFDKLNFVVNASVRLSHCGNRQTSYRDSGQT